MSRKKRITLEQEEYARLYEELKFYEPYQKKYDRIMTQIERHKKLAGRTKADRQPIPPEVWVTAGANLLGIVAIVTYEHAHVLTSKAMMLIRKP